MEKQASKTKKNIIFKLFSKHPSFLLIRKSPHTTLNINKTSCNKKTNNKKSNKEVKITANYNKHPSDKHSQNPTSLKISCFGGLLPQKNNKKKKMTMMNKKLDTKPLVYRRARTVQRLYSTGRGNGRNTYVVSRIPNSVEVRRLASRHETFKKFDRRVCYEDLEKDDDDDDDDDDDGEQELEEVVIDVSSINLGGEDVSLEPRKEVNLWNRRSKLPPPPLQLI